MYNPHPIKDLSLGDLGQPQLCKWSPQMGFAMEMKLLQQSLSTPMEDLDGHPNILVAKCIYVVDPNLMFSTRAILWSLEPVVGMQQEQ